MNNQDPRFDVALRGLAVTASLVIACGDPSSTSQTGATDTSGGTTTAGPTTTTATMTSESTTDPTTSGTGPASGTTTTSGSTTESITSTISGTSTTTVETTTVDTTTVDTTVDTTVGSTTGGSTTTLETTGDSTTGEMGCGGFNNLEFSYIWIANSAESTLSKIDTKTGVELARYATNADPKGNPIGGPSRTSVSVLGDAVVADRQGFLVKFHAIEGRCVDKNNNGMIDTSTNQVALPYGEDECLAWSAALPSGFEPPPVGYQAGPRAVGWTAPSECKGDDSNVWVGWCDEIYNGRVALHAGDDGAQIQTYDLGFVCAEGAYGPYGAVVDDANDLWVMSRSGNFSNNLFRVSYGCDPNQDTCVTEYVTPYQTQNYGINIAGDGHIWMSAWPDRVVRFDPIAESWTDYGADLDAKLPPGNNLLRGLVIDADGIVWIALGNSQVGIGADPRLIRLDPAAQPASVQTWGPETITELLNPVGMSIDVDGYLWMVDSAANKAYKIDPSDPTKYTVIGGLVTPYTYSDMTGYALSLVVPQ